jgi:hypothetical protein
MMGRVTGFPRYSADWIGYNPAFISWRFFKMPLSSVDQQQWAGAVNATVDRYFEQFNGQNFDEVAALFAEQGVLCPPFEAGIVGPEAIAQYLKAEATGMEAFPLDREVNATPTGGHQVVVKGRVKTPLFSVNVRWTFDLSASHTLERAEIKLLASLQELLQFNRG